MVRSKTEGRQSAAPHAPSSKGVVALYVPRPVRLVVSVLCSDHKQAAVAAALTSTCLLYTSDAADE